AATATTAGSLVTAVHDTAGGPDGSADLVLGGGAATERSDVQLFQHGTTASNATTVAHLPAPRSDAGAVTLGATTYLLGGFGGGSLDTTVLATTDGTDVHQVGTLAHGVRYPAVAALDGAIYVMGGVTGTSEGATTDTADVQRFDPATGRSTVIGQLPQPVGHAMGAALDGSLWLLGGTSGTTTLGAIERIDPATGAVTSGGTLPGPRSDAGVAVVGGAVWLFGGEHGSTTHPLASVVRLTPA
ncbi:MAG TPA: kelch repeat-containing protein, partial [Acidimicrobiales bacterium]|nr:kelch repeat-containing protein [Acidimicrobiales bacterium]